MYLNTKNHFLSKSIMLAAIVKIVAAFCEGGIRLFMRKSTLLSPDMLDIYLWHSQIVISLLQIFVTALIFYLAYKKLNYYIKLFDRDDLRGMGELQKEYLGDNIASLSVSSVNRLLQLWAVIFVGAELIYVFTSIMYRKFIQLWIQVQTYCLCTRLY